MKPAKDISLMLDMEDAMDRGFIAFGVFEGEELQGSAKFFDAHTKLLSKYMADGDFKGKAKETIMFHVPDKGMPPRVLVIGLGKKENCTPDIAREAAAIATKESLSLGIKNPILHFMGDGYSGLNCSYFDLIQATVEGGILGTYKYDFLMTENKDEDKGNIESMLIGCIGIDELEFTQKDKDLCVHMGCDGSTMDNKMIATQAIKKGEAIAHGVWMARDAANAPSNHGTPEDISNWAKSLEKIQDGKTKVNVLNRKDMKKLKMGGLLAVAQGSTLHEPTFTIIEFMNGKPDQKPVVVIGKGITFDTGGISLKPGAMMHNMTGDKGGGSAILGIMRAIIKMNLPINIIGLIPATFNMPDGDAYKPGDVITTMSGRTVEVQNTDAEGRMILIDALTYAERYDPKWVIDIATLTGAIGIALGDHAIGAFTNTQELIDKVLKAGEMCSERAWQLPLWKVYHSALKSKVADVRNIGGRPAGSITAAAFLSKWATKFPWVHLDIAGVAWNAEPKAYQPKGLSTGAGVRIVSEFVCSSLE